MKAMIEEHTLEPGKGGLPRAFILRRLHSIVGVWLVLYLCQHLLVNSRMAFFLQDEGAGFINAVNKIHALPYLKAIELGILALPFLIHGVWGAIYALTGKPNAHRTEGNKPALPQYKRNRAYSWQRITSWILLIGILAHVVQMRFLDYPKQTLLGDKHYYAVSVTEDPGLAKVTQQLGATLLPEERGKIVALVPSAGAAFLLIVRDTFKNPLMVILYSLLVIASTFHAFNGLWTFMITWGLSLTRRSQRVMRWVTTTLMGVVTALGLMAAWGTYWVVQFQG